MFIKKISILSFFFIFNVSAMTPMEIYKNIAGHIFQSATEKKKCLSVAFVDSGGHLNYFEKQDCAIIGSVQTSIQKAISANAFRLPTSEFVKAIASGKIGILNAKDLFAVEGGIPLISNNQNLGAIGIGGASSREDEEFAKEAIAKILK